jgi:aryl-alcohol dehydrogenase-like predicted oxidoreductase
LLGGKTTIMQKRQLGRSGLQVAPLTFGGNVFGWTIDEATSFQLLDAFTGAGFNLIDTADVYSRWAPGNKGGESETIIGSWMRQRGNRDKVIIATKVGGDMGQGKKDTSKKYILSAVEASLKRLQTDYIDLYQTHWDVEEIPVEETLEAYAQLVKEGKVRVIGASNFSPARLKASLEASKKHGYPRYETYQPHYNLIEREIFEKELEPICEENQLGVINYWSLASGFLTGKYRSEADLDKSPRGAGVKKYLDERGFRILAALDAVAAEYESTPASVALAWLIARPSVTAPIASATSLQQLDSLIKAAGLSLDKAAIRQLNTASDYAVAQPA